MPALTDYLDAEALDELQSAFSGVARAPLRICDGADRPCADDAQGTELLRAPIRAGGQAVGYVAVETAALAQPPDTARREWLGEFVRMAADVVSRLCEREKRLRDLARDLATRRRLTSKFTGERDLQVVLDTVARTVVETLDAKACSIRLLSKDGRELLIQAVHNLSEEYLNKGPILVDQSAIDREVLRTRKAVYIADEGTDPRVLYPAEARREGIVSALCAPMIYKGTVEGIIRVYTGARREFDWLETSLLEAIASEAAAAIVNARLYAEGLRSASMRRALAMAGEVQRRMIPAQPPEIPGFDIACAYVPTYELSGDFYDFIHLPEDNWGVAMCDVSGKGVRASLLMASIRASLRGHAVNVFEMSEVLNKVNRDLCADTLTSDFATLFYGVLDTTARRLTYTNAGHVPPILFRDGRTRYLESGGMVIGIDPDRQYPWESFILNPGDMVLLYTDGLSDALDFNDEAFGRDRIEKAALEAINMDYSAEAIVRHVLWTMQRFAGLQRRFDDTSLVAIRAT